MAKILLVDDEMEFVDMLCLRLKKSGNYELFTAYDGEEGLRLAKEKMPDLILLDLWLPKMDGFQVMETLKKGPETTKIPIIFLTASAKPESLKKITDQGTCEYVIKPFEWPELLEKIKKCLKQQ